MTRTTKGVLWIVLPFLALPAILMAWGFLSYFFSALLAVNASPSEGSVLTLRIVNIVLGFCGIASIIMVPVGLVMGVITLLKKDTMPTTMASAPPTSQQPSAPPSDPFQKNQL